MSKSSKLLIAVLAIAAVVLVGIVVSNRPVEAPAADAQESASEETNGSPFFSKGAPQLPSQIESNEGPTEMSAAATNLMSGREDKVDEILGSGVPEADKAKRMIELFPTLPPNGQEEVARHLTNLLPDQDYGLLRTYLTNASLPENVLDVLLGDVLNRPNRVKLPALLEVSRDTQHPKAAEAKDFLQLFLEQDYGSDWDKWQAGVEQWLKAHPD